MCGEIIFWLGGNLTILFSRKHIALHGERWPFYVSLLYISPGWLGLVRKAQTLGFMASLPLDVCAALSNCSDFSETQHHHIQRGLLTSSPDGWYEDSGIFKSQAGTQALWLLRICSQNTVNSVGAVTLIFYNCLFHLWFPPILFRERKVSYQLIFASFILQRPSEEEAFIKYFWKEGKKDGKNELLRRVIKWLKAFTLESN